MFIWEDMMEEKLSDRSCEKLLFAAFEGFLQARMLQKVPMKIIMQSGNIVEGVVEVAAKSFAIIKRQDFDPVKNHGSGCEYLVNYQFIETCEIHSEW